MISKLLPLLLAGVLFAQDADWISAGNRALDRGRPDEAAEDFRRALQAGSRAGTPDGDLLHLRVTLATAYMEAGRYRDAEGALKEAQTAAAPADTGIPRAELLNAWSALHLRLGQLSEAETDLQEARRIAVELQPPGDLLAAVLNNLAAIEMRTGRYARALDHEQESLRRFQETLGPDHPTLIRAWASLASAQFLAGQSEEARASLVQAVWLAEKTFGPAHQIVADLLESEAVVLEKLKLKKNAREARDRARKIRGGVSGAAGETLTWGVREVTPPGQVSVRSK